MAFLLAKPTPRNLKLGTDRFSMFNKRRDIPIYGPKVRYGLGIPWLYVPPEQLASFLLGLALHIRCLYNAALTMGEYMKKWLFALVCASTFLLAQNAVAAVQFTRFAHCGEGLVTAHTCECHASNSRIWHYCHAGYYCHTFDGSCRK